MYSSGGGIGSRYSPRDLFPYRFIRQCHDGSAADDVNVKGTCSFFQQELRHHNLRGVGEDVAGAAAGLRRRVRRAPPPEQDGLPRHAGAPALAQGLALNGLMP